MKNDYSILEGTLELEGIETPFEFSRIELEEGKKVLRFEQIVKKNFFEMIMNHCKINECKCKYKSKGNITIEPKYLLYNPKEKEYITKVDFMQKKQSGEKLEGFKEIALYIKNQKQLEDFAS